MDVVVDGVSQGPSTTSYTFNNVTADHTITASFTNSSNWVIWATNGAGGTISPYGGVDAPYGSSHTFTITPNTGYHIADVLVNSTSVGAVSTYSFTYPDYSGDQTIRATFAPDVITNTITASAGANGSISPSGAVLVAYGASQTFNIIPVTGYHVANVLVDGSSVGPVTSYTFENVTTGHTIAASFSNTYTIIAGGGRGGTVSPSGSVQVTPGSSPAFSIVPATGYNIRNVLVDGASVGPLSSYIFPNVSADHTLAATFIAQVIRITANLTRIRVPLGGRAHFWVKLTDNPYTDVRVAVTWQSGNPEISVQRGADLFFTPLNWDLYHPVGLAATRANQDNANPAVFLLSNPAVTPLVVEAETVKGMPQKVGPWLYFLLGQ